LSRAVKIRQAHNESGSREAKIRTGGERGWVVEVRCVYRSESSERGRYIAVETMLKLAWTIELGLTERVWT
jgi:hypothetical protein